MKQSMNAFVRHEMWLLFKQRPWFGIKVAVRVGCGVVISWVSPKLALRLAMRDLRRADALLKKGP